MCRCKLPQQGRTIAIFVLRIKLVLQQGQLLGVYATLARRFHHCRLLLLCKRKVRIATWGMEWHDSHGTGWHE